MFGNVPGKLVDSETALRCLLTTHKIDVSFLHELDSFRHDEVIRIVECKLSRNTRRALATRLVVTVITERSTHELHQALVGDDEFGHLVPLVRSLSDLARHALVVRVILVVEWVAYPALAFV